MGESLDWELDEFSILSAVRVLGFGGGEGAQITVDSGHLAEAGIGGNTFTFLFRIHFRTHLPSVPRAAPHALRLTLTLRGRASMHFSLEEASQPPRQTAPGENGVPGPLFPLLL